MKEAEFEAFRRQVSCKPESRLQAELSILQLEKVSSGKVRIHTYMCVVRAYTVESLLIN